MKRVVVIDIDGVLADFNSAFRRLLISRGAEMKPFECEDPSKWHWFEHYGATKTQADAAWGYVEQNPFWWNSLGLHRDVDQTVDTHLWKVCCKHEVTFITSRPAGCRDATVHWLKDKFTFEHDPMVIVTPRTKVPALISLAPDVVLEDKGETLVEFESLMPVAPKRSILIKRAYNVHWHPAASVTTVDSTLAGLQMVLNGSK